MWPFNIIHIYDVDFHKAINIAHGFNRGLLDDKIEYAENHPEEDVWIILHFSEPQERFTFIKPIKGKKYERHKIIIRQAGEIFCIFTDINEELKTLEEFSEYLKAKLDEVSGVNYNSIYESI